MCEHDCRVRAGAGKTASREHTLKVYPGFLILPEFIIRLLSIVLLAFVLTTVFAVGNLYAAQWYVDANSGNDTMGDGSSGTPFQTINRALVETNVGDTVNIMSGVYTEEVVFDTDGLAFIGSDSSTTILDYGDSTFATGAVGFKIQGTSGDKVEDIFISGLTIKNYYYAIEVEYLVNARIEDVTVDNNGYFGALLDYVQYSSLKGNVFSRNYDGVHLRFVTHSELENNLFLANRRQGIYVYQNNSFDTLVNNTSRDNEESGFALSNSTNNILINNLAVDNIKEGFDLGTGSENNRLENNIARGSSDSWRGSGFSIAGSRNDLIGNLAKDNSAHGILLSNADSGNVLLNTVTANQKNGFQLENATNYYFAQNTVYSNVQAGIAIGGTSSGNSFLRNNISGSVQNDADYDVDFRRNYWDSTDSEVIAGSVVGTSPGRVEWEPFRLGTVDTGAGADTVAPEAPGYVVVTTTSDTSATLQWDEAVSDEDGSSLTGLAGYKIYLSQTAGTSSWQYAGTTVDTGYVVDSLSSGNEYYFRVTAFDTHTSYPNESFYSDSVAHTTILSSYSGPEWYVSASTGSDVNNGSEAAPFQTIDKALQEAVAGDTIYLTAGVYKEKIVFDKDNIAIIGPEFNGADTAVIDLGSLADTIAFEAVGRDGWLLKNLQIRNADVGVAWFNNTNNSKIENLVIDDASYGIYMENSSTNEIINCRITVVDTESAAIRLEGTSNITLQNNKMINGGLVVFGNAQAQYTSNNIDVSNTTNGKPVYYWINESNKTVPEGAGQIYLINTDNVTVENQAITSASIGIAIGFSGSESSSANNVIKNNVISDNSESGIALLAAYGNVIEDNITNNNSGGINVLAGSAFNIVRNNSSENNVYEGILVEESNNNLIRENYLAGNKDGLYLDDADSNTVISNRAESNNIGFLNRGENNYFAQNRSAENAEAGFHLDLAAPVSVAGEFRKNNIYDDVNNYTASDFDFSYNYWNTTDSEVIAGRLGGGHPERVGYLPFRTSEIDTDIGADTIAPSAPGILGVDTGTLGKMTVEWSEPVTNEDGSSPANIDGYRLYRFTQSDTDNWEEYLVVDINSGDTSYTDSQITFNDTYYYRVVAYNSHTGAGGREFQNRSWYSDTFEIIQEADVGIVFDLADGHDTRSETVSVRGTEVAPQSAVFEWRKDNGEWAEMTRESDVGGNFHIAGITLQPGSNKIEARLVDSSSTFAYEVLNINYYPQLLSWRRPFEKELVSGKVRVYIQLNTLAGDTVELKWAKNDSEDTVIPVTSALNHDQPADSIYFTMNFPDTEPARYQLTLRHLNRDGTALVNRTRDVVYDTESEIFDPDTGADTVIYRVRQIRGPFSAGTLVSLTRSAGELSDTVQMANAACADAYDSVSTIADLSLTRVQISGDTDGTFELELPFNINDLSAGVEVEDLEIYRLDESIPTWTQDNVVTIDRRRVDGDTWVVVAEVTGFSVFQIMAGVGAPGLTDFIVGPNPFRADRDGHVEFQFNSNSGGIFEIEIYTITGRRVLKDTTVNNDKYEWHDAGKQASGYYIYRVKDRETGQDKTGKLAIIR